MTLHIVSQSPEAGPALASCLRVIAGDDVVILLNDGIYALASQKATLLPLIAERRLFALADDLKLRGFKGFEAQTINYERFVELSCQHNPIQSWY
ncbi:MAG: sulfurtransferase complex subunit TusB [Marinagarivorans sp.]|nr:sulfurtransferase complex subunit TusB [Marinagarivorans sp.]